jgi:structure-specific recognition protein 1
VFVPKQFQSKSQQSCVRCSVKANEGLLYPLAKSLIFINKPTILIRFEDIESVEILRYEALPNSATRNFDIQVTLKPEVKSEAREYTFSSIDRGEFASLNDFFTVRNLNVIIPEVIACSRVMTCL